MKTYLKTLLLTALFSAGSFMSLQAQDDIQADSTGLPGDHFSLEGALELFKKSESLEDFEKKLNDESSNVNNLDLDEDGKIDYIRVEDNMDGDVHAITLQVPFSEKESQDIAVIGIEKTGPESAILQIVGDEDIYGEQVYAEPFSDEKVDKGSSKNGPSAGMAPVRVVVNVWLWPCVRWMYRPAYVVYASPYYWGVYPRWWRPWRPRPWRTFYVGWSPWRTRYHRVTVHRVTRAHRVYTPRRRTTTVVHTRTRTHVNRYGKPSGRKTVKKTTVTGPNGRATKTTTTKSVTGPNGRTATKKTTTTKAQGRNGGTVGKKTTTTKAQGRNGANATKRTTTKKAQGRNGRSATKKTTTSKAQGRRGGTVGKKTTTKKATGRKGNTRAKKSTTVKGRKRGG